MAEDDEGLVDIVIQRLTDLTGENEYDRDQIRQILRMAMGNLDEAVQLYMENYLALEANRADDDDEEAEDNVPEDPPDEGPEEVPEGLIPNNDEIMVSVSDDDIGLLIGGKPVEKRKTVAPPPKRKKTKRDDLEGDAYLSDNDWLWESLMDRNGIPLASPTALLWGGDSVSEDENEDEDDNFPIPRTWLHASFSWKDEGGLALQPRQSEDWGHARWEPGEPYHCRGLSCILSIVTGLMYTGARMQAQNLYCAPVEQPTKANLVDALTALLWVAAEASRNRKRPVALQSEKRLANKLRLCPTCRWDDELVATSYTNLHDLRQYVLGALQSYTSSGGVALLLETIVRIHGKGAIARMLKQARRKDGKPMEERPALIRCTCMDRHEERVEKASLRERAELVKSEDTTPFGNECVSVELISLLLTGKVHTSWEGWSTGTLGLGFLAPVPRPIDARLTRPKRPVWLLEGESGFSVVVLKECQDFGRDQAKFAVMDAPGSVAQLFHWNPWYGIQQATKVRMVTAGDPTASPTSVKATIKSPAKGPESISPGLVFTAEELDEVEAHPDDQKYYKDRFRYWRYRFGGDWVPFHRLSERDRFRVETKLGPRLQAILWTRWPRATLDRFQPGEPVV